MTTQNTTDTAPSTANDTPCMFATPQKEHEWLQQFVGSWTFESQCMGEPGKPADTFKGTEQVKSIGGLWIVGEGKGEMPGGGEGHMRLTLGFDPKRNRYIGTWIGSMMTHLWIYEGELDPSGRILTLNAEGPSFTGQGMARYQDIYEIKSSDHRVLTSRSQGADGQWTQFMTAHYRRTK